MLIAHPYGFPWFLRGNGEGKTCEAVRSWQAAAAKQVNAPAVSTRTAVDRPVVAPGQVALIKLIKQAEKVYSDL